MSIPEWQQRHVRVVEGALRRRGGGVRALNLVNQPLSDNLQCREPDELPRCDNLQCCDSVLCCWIVYVVRVMMIEVKPV